MMNVYAIIMKVRRPILEWDSMVLFLMETFALHGTQWKYQYADPGFLRICVNLNILCDCVEFHSPQGKTQQPPRIALCWQETQGFWMKKPFSSENNYSWKNSVWDSDVFLKSVTNRPRLSKCREGRAVRKNILYIRQTKVSSITSCGKQQERAGVLVACKK